jgi:hypothetical protein
LIEVCGIQVVKRVEQLREVPMTQQGHGGARRGAGRKPHVDRKVKRSVSLSASADAIVLAAMQLDETYSQTLDRLICGTMRPAEVSTPMTTPVAVLVAALSDTREPVAAIYRRLGWSRQVFEQIVQTQREQLALAGVRLHVATKDAASGRREQYITIDGMRYSALSRDRPSPRSIPNVEVVG